MTCSCGCGATPKNESSRFIRGHNLKAIRIFYPDKAKVTEMYLFLWRRYRGWDAVSKVTGIPLSTIEKTRGRRGRHLSKRNYIKLDVIYSLYHRK